VVTVHGLAVDNEAHRALVLAESLEKPEAMISAIRLKV
jgi:hypothetical protein